MGRAFEYRKARKLKRWGNMARTFTKLGKEIEIAVKAGGPDPGGNVRLRVLIQNAKAANMPKENVERAIKRAISKDTADYKEMVYEGYGPYGIAMIVETATDNTNRTIGNVRAFFSKYHGNLGTTGCVSFMFEEKGLITVEKEECPLDEEALMELALEAGAEDFSSEDEDYYEITTAPADLTAVQEAVTAKGVRLESADLSKIPSNYVDLDSEDDVKYMSLLLDKLEEDDDVQQVYHNWNGPED